MKYILISLLLCPLTMMAMESQDIPNNKKRSLGLDADDAQGKNMKTAIVDNNTNLNKQALVKELIVVKALLYQRSSDSAPRHILTQTAKFFVTSFQDRSHKIYTETCVAYQKMQVSGSQPDYNVQRSHRLHLSVKAVDFSGKNVDIEYDCKKESDDCGSQSNSEIKTTIIDVIEPACKSIDLDNNLREIHNLNGYSLTLSADKKLLWITDK